MRLDFTVTAKAGRPDTNRAGNEILRMIAEGRIPWRFLSQDVKASTIDSVNGVWIDMSHLQTDLTQGHIALDESDQNEESEQESPEGDGASEALPELAATPSESEESDSDEETLVQSKSKTGGMFGALAIDEPASDSDSE